LAKIHLTFFFVVANKHLSINLNVERLEKPFAGLASNGASRRRKIIAYLTGGISGREQGFSAPGVACRAKVLLLSLPFALFPAGQQ